jgi:hypothetical protein
LVGNNKQINLLEELEMQKCIVKVVFKDGQTDLIQVDFMDSEAYTEYRAFDLYAGLTYKLEEIKFVRMVERY